MKKLIAILILSTLILCACHDNHDSKSKNNHDSSQKSTHHVHKKEIKNGRTYYDDILIVNKTTTLPPDYNPGENPKAQRALQRMFADAGRRGCKSLSDEWFQKLSNTSESVSAVCCA